MQVVLRSVRAPLRSSSPGRTAAALVLLAGFLIIVCLGALQTSRRIGDLGHRRTDALASRSDPAEVADEAADAFRRFRSALRGGERFALVFSPDVDRDRRGFYQLVALSVLYPAIASSDPAQADAVMVFGEKPPQSVQDTFGEIAVMDGIWLGRRRR